jgi:molecular chaperone DnaK (HSP70)
MTTPRYFGVDFGTSWSKLAEAVYEGDGTMKPRALLLDENGSQDRFPSAVYVSEQGNWIVGEEALSQGSQRPQRLFVSFKPRLGGSERELDGKLIYTEDLARRVIGTLLDHHEVQDSQDPIIVICHPVGDEWRRLISKIVPDEFRHVHYLSEPEAVLYYAHHSKQVVFTEQIQTVLFIDFGGGTCDFLLLKVHAEKSSGVARPMIDFVGDARLDFAGQDIDRMIRDKFADTWRNDHPRWEHLWESLSAPEFDWRLMRYAREVKEKLAIEYGKGNRDKRFPVEISGLPKNTKLKTTMTAAELRELTFEEMIERFGTLLSHERPPAQGNSLWRKGVTPADVSMVILAGGSSKVPWLSEEILPELLPTLAIHKRIIHLRRPEMAVAFGAAMRAWDIDAKIDMIPRFLQEDLLLAISGGATISLAEYGTRVPLDTRGKGAHRYFRFPMTGDILTLQLLREGRTSMGTSRVVPYPPREVHFPGQIAKGTWMKIRTEIDRNGEVYIHLAPALALFAPRGADLAVEVLFDPLTLARELR